MGLRHLTAEKRPLDRVVPLFLARSSTRGDPMETQCPLGCPLFVVCWSVWEPIIIHTKFELFSNRDTHSHAPFVTV